MCHWHPAWQAVTYKKYILFSKDPAMTFLGIYPKELKTYFHENLYMDVYRNFIHNCQNLEVTKMSSVGK
jgi:hypothetical protein